MQKVKFMITLTIEVILVLFLCIKYNFNWVDAFFTIGVAFYSVLLVFLLNVKGKTGNFTGYQRARFGYEVEIEDKWPLINPVMLASGLFCVLSLIVSGLYYI